MASEGIIPFQMMSPEGLRYTQASISNRFRNGRKIGHTLHDLCEKECFVEDISPISVYYRRGHWWSLDNRRLWAFKRFQFLGGCETIPVIKVPWRRSFRKTFTTKNDGLHVKIRGTGGPGGCWYFKARNCLQHVFYLNPIEIRHTDTSISNRFPNGELIGQILDKFCDGDYCINCQHPIRVFYQHESWWTHDNKMLWVFKMFQFLGSCEPVPVIKILPRKCDLFKIAPHSKGDSIQIRGGEGPGGHWYIKPQDYLVRFIQLSPSTIRHSKSSFSNRFPEGNLIGETLDEFCEGECYIDDLIEIEVFYYNGSWWTHDNELLWVFKMFQFLGGCQIIPVTQVPFRKHDFHMVAEQNGCGCVEIQGVDGVGGQWYKNPPNSLKVVDTPCIDTDGYSSECWSYQSFSDNESLY